MGTDTGKCPVCAGVIDGLVCADYANDAEALEMILTENEWLKIARFKTVSRMSAEVQDSPAIMFFVHPQHWDWLQA